MMRIALYLAGVSAAVAAWSVYRRLGGSTRTRVPVKQAAAMLQQAWADNHTRV
jgi:hypothetical protein